MGPRLAPAAQDYAERDGLHGSTLALGPLARPDPSELGGAIRRAARVERDAHGDGQRSLFQLLAGSYLLLAPTARPRMRSTPAYETAAITNQHSHDAPSELPALLLPDIGSHASPGRDACATTNAGLDWEEVAGLANSPGAQRMPAGLAALSIGRPRLPCSPRIARPAAPARTCSCRYECRCCPVGASMATPCCSTPTAVAPPTRPLGSATGPASLTAPVSCSFKPSCVPAGWSEQTAADFRID
jgi:hypothetical protein